ncbi:hypothetical protein N9W62_09990 [Akkermansiaceae bacterium]|nr:hypothetical protein [Akkermansiaceae bacterium]
MENPYQAPESETQVNGVSPRVPKPSQVTVFGILHLLVATVGFGGIIFNKLDSNNPRTSILQSFQKDKEAPAEFTPEALEALDKALSLNLYFEIFSVILATMLLNARWGVGLSHKYSLLSIIAKIASIILIIIIAFPAYQTFCDGISGANETIVKTLCLVYKLGGVAGAFIMMIYPITSWILLTRQNVKDFQQSL